VDIHNHILPGIDDGADTVADSMALLKGFSDFGVTTFICSPHIMHNYYENTPKTIKKSLKKLKKKLKEEHWDSISLTAAAEHMIDDNFDHLLENDGIMPMGENHLLVEMSFLQPPIHFNESTQKITSAGYFPILAHPERYGFLNTNTQKYTSFKENSMLFQVNLLSLAGYYGNHVKQIANKLIAEGLVEFLGSDVHNMSQLKLLKECTIAESSLKKIKPLIQHTIATFS